LKVMGRSSIQKVEVRADGTGLSSRAGTALLPLAAERLGLTDALGWALGETRERRSAHDPGRVFCDLAVMLADGGRCVSDLVALGSQSALFGDVASISTARRVLLSVGEAELDRLRAARAQARARAWAAGAAPEQVILDFDATPITAHSDKEHAAGHYKGGFGFHPLLVSCGRELLAGILRPGNAGANNADDHLQVFELALEQLPPAALEGPILARSDSAGASHALADACRETGVRFSFGYAIDERVRAAILALPERAWRPAINADNQPREGAWVAELTGQVGLDAWPQGSRLIVRRERPHPARRPRSQAVGGALAATTEAPAAPTARSHAHSWRYQISPPSSQPHLALCAGVLVVPLVVGRMPVLQFVRRSSASRACDEGAVAGEVAKLEVGVLDRLLDRFEVLPLRFDASDVHSDVGNVLPSLEPQPFVRPQQGGQLDVVQADRNDAHRTVAEMPVEHRRQLGVDPTRAGGILGPQDEHRVDGYQRPLTLPGIESPASISQSSSHTSTPMSRSCAARGAASPLSWWLCERKTCVTPTRYRQRTPLAPPLRRATRLERAARRR